MAFFERVAELSRRTNAPESLSSIPISTCFKRLQDVPPYKLARLLALIDKCLDDNIPVRDLPEFSNRALKKFKSGIHTAFTVKQAPTASSEGADGGDDDADGPDLERHSEDMPAKTRGADAPRSPFSSGRARRVAAHLKCARNWEDVVRALDRCMGYVDESADVEPAWPHYPVRPHPSLQREADPALVAEELAELFQQVEDIITNVMQQETEEDLKRWVESADELAKLEEQAVHSSASSPSVHAAHQTPRKPGWFSSFPSLPSLTWGSKKDQASAPTRAAPPPPYKEPISFEEWWEFDIKARPDFPRFAARRNYWRGMAIRYWTRRFGSTRTKGTIEPNFQFLDEAV